MAHTELGRRGFLRLAAAASALTVPTARTAAASARNPLALAWQSTYGGMGEQGFADVASAHGDGWVLVGVDEGTDMTKVRPWIVGVAPDGTKRWARHPEPGSDGLYAILRTDDGYAVSGEDGRFALLDRAGRVRSASTLGGEDPLRRPRLAGIDGGFALGAVEPTPQTASSVVVGLTPDGAERWRRSYRTEYGLSFLLPRDGGVVAGGGYLGEGGPWLASVAPDGTERWKEVLSTPEWFGSADAVPAGDGLTIVGGDGLLHLDGTREVAWKRRYDALADTYPSALVRTADGGYAFAGIQEDTGFVRISKADADGDLVWTAVHGDTPNQVDRSYEVSALIERAPGEYLVAGGRSGGPDAWVGAFSETGTAGSPTATTSAAPARTTRPGGPTTSGTTASETTASETTARTATTSDTRVRTVVDDQAGFGALAALSGLAGAAALWARRR